MAITTINAARLSRNQNRITRRVGVSTALALLRAYKLVASPSFYGSCRFVPSCADFASEAVMRHGVIHGGWLAFKRLARCQPLCHGGLDPVPASRDEHLAAPASVAPR